MIVTSFYTANGLYPGLAQRLAASCKRFGLPHEIRKASDQGDWIKTIAIKSRWMLSQLMQHRQPILWCDCDCEIVADLAGDVLDSLANVDVAFYNWHCDPSNNLGYRYDPKRCLCAGGVMYFAYTAPAFELLVRWIEAIALKPDIVDDQVFDGVWLDRAAGQPALKTLWLPITWNWMTGHRGQPGPNCVIRHDYVAGGHRDPPKQVSPGFEQPQGAA